MAGYEINDLDFCNTISLGKLLQLTRIQYLTTPIIGFIKPTFCFWKYITRFRELFYLPITARQPFT